MPEVLFGVHAEFMLVWSLCSEVVFGVHARDCKPRTIWSLINMKSLFQASAVSSVQLDLKSSWRVNIKAVFTDWKRKHRYTLICVSKWCVVYPSSIHQKFEGHLGLQIKRFSLVSFDGWVIINHVIKPCWLLNLETVFTASDAHAKSSPPPPPWYKEGVNGIPPSSFFTCYIISKRFLLSLNMLRNSPTDMGSALLTVDLPTRPTLI